MYLQTIAWKLILDLQDNLSKRDGTGTGFHLKLKNQNSSPVNLSAIGLVLVIVPIAVIISSFANIMSYTM